MTLFADYIYGLAGLSLLQRWYTDDAPARRQRLIELAADFETNDVLGLEFATPEHETQAGYSLWADSYDGENAMITAEEQLVQPRLEALFEPGNVALDAGCGTGRHAATMATIGYDVIGTDLTPAMLDVARAKAPTVDFRQGVFEDLPVDSASVDLIVTALAVCHAIDLNIVFAEFARVLKPGGTLLLSDPHPGSAPLGAQAFFQGEGFDLPWVRNRAHPISAYINALGNSGFTIEQMEELPYDEAILETNPAAILFPDVTANALLGLPFIVYFEARLR